MHYYKHHIGDYARSTNHLSFIEHGIYRMLLDAYYESERPLEADLPKLMRRYRIRTAAEKRAFLSVLDEFFTRTEKGYEHARCECEIQRANRVSGAARDAALERWSARKLKENTRENKANFMRTHCEPGRAAERRGHAVDATHEPIPINQKEIETDNGTQARKHRDLAPALSHTNTTHTVDNGSFIHLESPADCEPVVTPFDF